VTAAECTCLPAGGIRGSRPVLAGGPQQVAWRRAASPQIHLYAALWPRGYHV